MKIGWYQSIKNYSLIAVALFVFTTNNLIAQSDSSKLDFEVVFTNSNIQFNNTPSGNLITGYRDQSILVSALDYTKLKPVIVYQSLDQGNSWNVLMEEIQDSSLNFITNIVQTTKNNICMVIKGFARDSLQNWITNYWVWFSHDLGQNWIKHNVVGVPLGFHFELNRGVFTSTRNDTSILWTTEDYGKSWNQRALPNNMLNITPARLSDKEFLFFDNPNDGLLNDSLYYTLNIDSNKWETKKLHENFGSNNFIAFDKNWILSAHPVWANIGTTALSYILETKNGGNHWSNPVNLWEDNVWARRGLSSNSNLDSNNMVFLGPNVLYYTINGGEKWNKSNWNDSINGGTSGVYMFYNSKLNKNQVVFPVTGSYIMRYTIPGKVGINSVDLQEFQLKIYPNPVKDYLSIQFIQKKKLEGFISVWSLDGKEILRKALHSIIDFNRITINVDHLNNGIYILRFETLKNSYHLKFVKQ